MGITERTDPSKVNFNFDATAGAGLLSTRFAGETTAYAKRVNELIFPLAAHNLKRSGSFPEVKAREGSEFVFKELLPIPGEPDSKKDIESGMSFYLRPSGVLVKMPSFTAPGSTDEYPELDKSTNATEPEVARLAPVVVYEVNHRIAKARSDRRSEGLGRQARFDNLNHRKS